MSELDRKLNRLAARVDVLERFVHFLAARLGEPGFFRGIEEAGFRYRSPDYRHFILLRACRLVSGLNASIALARAGYPQEIGVVLRTVIEYYTQVEYVLVHRDSKGTPEGKAAKFVDDFFHDSRRSGPTSQAKRVKLRQEDVHDAVGKSLDEFSPKGPDQKTPSQLMSRVYIAFSNYVHGRYPESMDLFGGRPGRFHLEGMLGTPKDAENIEMIDTLTTSVSHCLVQVVQGLDLYNDIQSDEILVNWYRSAVDGH